MGFWTPWATRPYFNPVEGVVSQTILGNYKRFALEGARRKVIGAVPDQWDGSADTPWLNLLPKISKVGVVPPLPIVVGKTRILSDLLGKKAAP